MVRFIGSDNDEVYWQCECSCLLAVIVVRLIGSDKGEVYWQ